jgi:hypothetical protein
MVTRKEIRAGALGDGPHVPVLATITSQAATPPFDFGTHTLRTKDHAAIVDIPALDAKGHYEQAHQLAGKLSVDGAIVRLDDGVGFRSRSWGQRDYRPIGCSSYVHAHFPGSGQMLMAITLHDAQGQPAFSHAIIGTAESITAPSLAGLPVAHDFQGTGVDYGFDLNTPGGRETVRAEVLNTIPMTFVGRAETCLGTVAGSEGHHDYVQAFTRFQWCDRVGYGVTERTVARISPNPGSARG